jgi:hypothetical protein
MQAMGAAKSGGQDVRVGEVFMECAEKKEFPGFGFFRQGANCALRGRKRLPNEKLQAQKLQAQRNEKNRSDGGGRVYTRSWPGSQNGNPGLTCRFRVCPTR